VPETVDWDTGSVVSGDDELVTAHGHLRLGSTGFWKFWGTVTDSGDGASFAFTITPKFFVDSFGKMLLFGEADSLDDEESASFDKQGRDLWITRNWDQIRSRGAKWHLEASTSLGAAEVFAIALGGLIAGAIIWGASRCTQQDGWTTTKNPDGSAQAVCHHD
jgi:hypothetical protein